MIHLLSFPNEPWAVVAFLAVSRKGGRGGGGMEGGCQIGTLGVALLESVLTSDSAPRLVFMGVHSFDFSIFI